MAGGIDWLRWHHGSVTDPKFALVARNSGASLPDVLAVWAYVLETASSATDRGLFGAIDTEALDCHFNFPGTETRTADILAAMEKRGLIADGRVTSWEKRQPKREDETANERKRRQREREHEAAIAESAEQRVTEEASRNVTPDHAEVTRSHTDVTHGHAREEERREEEKEISEPSVPRRRPKASDRVPDCPYGVIVDLYHELLPELPGVVRIETKGRKEGIRKAWAMVLSEPKRDGTLRAETPEAAIEWFRRYFHRARENDFVMGRSARSQGHENWQADLDFLMTDRGMKQVIEKTREAA